MDRLKLSYDGSGNRTDPERIRELAGRIEPELARLSEARDQAGENHRIFCSLPEREETIWEVERAAESLPEPDLLVLVGMGGSSLGAKAVHQAVSPEDGPELVVLDNLNPLEIREAVGRIEEVLEHGGEVVVNVVSKSGGTTETMANFEVLAERMRDLGIEPADRTAVTTSPDSPLADVAEERGYTLLEIPEGVVGRYSVLSSAGLFPLLVAGVNVRELLEGASNALESCLEMQALENPAARSAAAAFHNLEEGRDVHDTMLYGSDLEGLGMWYRQLAAESLGKRDNLEGEEVRQGFTPTVSVGTRDLHSVYQLFMGGPDDRYHTLVWTKDSSSGPEIREETELSGHLDLEGRGTGEITNAIFRGVNATLEEAGRPKGIVELEDRSAGSIGEFLQFKMVETVLLAQLMEVNPFNQPEVEMYKEESRRILKNR